MGSSCRHFVPAKYFLLEVLSDCDIKDSTIKSGAADAKEGETPKTERTQSPMTGQLTTLIALLGIGALLANLGRPDAQEISFQHFKTQLLSRGLVDKVEVTNKTTAKVFVRTGSKCVFCSASHIG